MALIDLFICICSLLETLRTTVLFVRYRLCDIAIFFLIRIFIMPERVVTSSYLLNSDFDKSLFPSAASESCR